MIRCRKCGEEKPEEAFGVESRKKSGRRSWCLDCSNNYLRMYNRLNRDKAKSHFKKWYEAHKERDAEKFRQKAKRWHSNNLEKCREARQNRKAISKLRRPELLIEYVSLRKVYTRDKEMCHLCGRYVEWEDATCDHLVALADGGEHSYNNVSLAHRLCNSIRVKRPVELVRQLLHDKLDH